VLPQGHERVKPNCEETSFVNDLFRLWRLELLALGPAQERGYKEHVDGTRESRPSARAKYPGFCTKVTLEVNFSVRKRMEELAPAILAREPLC